MMPADFPAFPQLHVGMKGDFPGMSLRDYFAGQALAGALANPLLTRDTSGYDIVAYAYDVADKMLMRRNRTPCLPKS